MRRFTSCLRTHHRGLTPIRDDRLMKLPVLRPLLVAAALLALALPPLASADRGDKTTDEGVVQSVSATEITLRELDGTVVSLAVGPSTRIRVNDRRATLADVRPGFVASVVHKGDEPALSVHAFGRIAPVVDRGVVTALAAEAITLRLDDGSSTTIPLDRGTRFRHLGRQVRRAAARPGAIVTVTYPPDGSATIVIVLKRA